MPNLVAVLVAVPVWYPRSSHRGDAPTTVDRQRLARVAANTATTNSAICNQLAHTTGWPPTFPNLGFGALVFSADLLAFAPEAERPLALQQRAAVESSNLHRKTNKIANS